MSDLTKPLIADGSSQGPVSDSPSKSVGSLDDLFPLVLDHTRTSCSKEVPMQTDIQGMYGSGDRTVVRMPEGRLFVVTAEGEKTEMPSTGLRDYDFQGKMVAVAAQNGNVSLWDITEMREIAAAPAHPSTRDVRFVPGQDQVVTCGTDNKVKLWGLSPLTELHCFEGHSASVSDVLISPDGKFALTNDDNNEYIVWDLTERKLCAQISLPGENVWFRHFSSDGKRLFLATVQHKVHVWSLESFTEVKTLTEFDNRIRGLATTPDCKKLVACGDSYNLFVWSLEGDISFLTEMKKHDWGVWKVIAIDNQYCASAGGDNSVRIWDLNSLSLYAVLLGHTNAVKKLYMNPEGDRLFSYSQDKTVRVWKFDISKDVFTEHRGAVDRMAMASRRNLLVSGSTDTTAIVWDLATSKSVAKLEGHTAKLGAVFFSKNEKYLITGANDGEVRAWSAATYDLIVSLKAHDSQVNFITESPDGKTFVTASDVKTIKQWTYESWANVGEYIGSESRVFQVAFTVTGSHLIAVGSDCKTRVWSVETKQQVSMFYHYAAAMCVVVTPDYILVGDNQMFVIVLNAIDFTHITSLAGHGTTVTCVAIAARKRKCVSGDANGVVIIWNMETYELEISLQAHSAQMQELVVFPGEDFFATVAKDKTTKVWSLESYRQVMKFEGHTDAINHAVLTPDCKHIITSSDDHTVRKHDVLELIERREETVETLAENYKRVTGNYLIGGYMDNLIKGKSVAMRSIHQSVQPYNFNALHIFAYFNHAEALSALLREGVPILSGAFGSPLSVAIRKNTRKCVDAILVVMNEQLEAGTNWLAIQRLTDDIPELLRRKSPHIRDFIAGVFRVRADLSQQILPLYPLPIVQYIPNWKLPLQLFAVIKGNRPVMQGSEVVDFQMAEFKWNFAAGSKESLDFLTACEDTEDTELLTSPLVSTVVKSKWEALWSITFTHALLYGLMLVVLTGITFRYDYAYELNIGFLAFNVLFILYEVLQGIAVGVEYWGDPWNYIDIIRGSLSIVWVLTGYQPLELYVIAFCFLRGFTFFRAFKMTRMFVRMTLEVVKEMYSFLIILGYSTLSFGMMYASLIPDEIKTPGDAWQTAYKLLMGEFSTDNFGSLEWVCFTAASLINIIIMLNLLISILGDAFGKAQESAAVNDTLEQLSLIIEYESILFWRRSFGSSQVLVSGDKDDSFEEVDLKAYVNTRLEVLTKVLTSRIDDMEASVKKEIAESIAKLAK